jgi:FkbM family methyltransferase
MVTDPSDGAQLLAALATARKHQGRPRPVRWLSRPRALFVTHAARWLQKRLSVSVPATARTFFGDRMRVRLPELVSSQLYLDGAFEFDLTETFCRLVRPGWVVFDVGAHLGYFTLLAARLVGPRGQVHAFEPTPATQSLLMRNTRNLENVRLVDRAVWSDNTTLSFQDFGTSNSAFNSAFAPRSSTLTTKQPKIHRVQTVPLDDYCAEAGVVPNLVKIDAESAESHVLAGMSRLMTESPPYITIELGDEVPTGSPSSRSLVNSVVQRGYSAVRMTETGLLPEVLHDTYAYTNLLLAPPGSNL